MKAIEILNYLIDEDNCTDFTSTYIQKAIDELEKSVKTKKVVPFSVLWDSTLSGDAISDNEDVEEFTRRIAEKAFNYAITLKCGK